MENTATRHDGSVRPLVLVFGSYRGTGQERLVRIAEYLRERSIRAYTVAEYAEDLEGPFLKQSFRCIDECNIAIFVFFRGETIAVTEHLEAVDQGPLIEFAYLCLCKKDHPTAVQVVFDSESRIEHMSRLFHELVDTSSLLDTVDYSPIQEGSPSAVIQAIQDETLPFCVNEYVKRGVW